MYAYMYVIEPAIMICRPLSNPLFGRERRFALDLRPGKSFFDKWFSETFSKILYRRRGVSVRTRWLTRFAATVGKLIRGVMRVARPRRRRDGKQRGPNQTP